jgi:hypothetical protein
VKKHTFQPFSTQNEHFCETLFGEKGQKAPKTPVKWPILAISRETITNLDLQASYLLQKPPGS